LLSKLQCYGIRDDELNWFESYLDKRMQCVALDGKLSEMLHVPIGVPQGSTLGPLLFLLYASSSSVIGSLPLGRFSQAHSEIGLIC
jgi:hypothetical protein